NSRKPTQDVLFGDGAGDQIGLGLQEGSKGNQDGITSQSDSGGRLESAEFEFTPRQPGSGGAISTDEPSNGPSGESSGVSGGRDGGQAGSGSESGTQSESD